MTAPYEAAARAYWDAGWRGILPLPANAKAPVPDGSTGAEGADPSWPDVQAWIDDGVPVRGPRPGERVHRPVGNIALRLPADVIGIDVDAYDGKEGNRTLDRLVETWGLLPPTWVSTSRSDYDSETGVGSGIRLYRVPAGLHWPGVLGPGIEIIQRRHRYAVVWPSVHPAGGTYQWHTHPAALGSIATGDHGIIPTPADLPELPPAWVEGITKGETATDHAKAALDTAEASAWLTGRNDGETCPVMAQLLTTQLTRLSSGRARHDAAVEATAALCYMAGEGHAGVTEALGEYRQAWYAALAAETGNRADDVNSEWRRLLAGAVQLAAAASPHPPGSDPCVNPFAGLVDNPATHDVSKPTWLTYVDPASGQASSQVASERGPGPDTTVAGHAGGPGPSEAWRAHMTAQEVERQRARRAAARQLDDEEALATFRAPPSRASLVDELAIPDPPIEWRIEQVMPAGANVVLTAPWKAGKTTLINHLTACLVDDLPFLGTYKVHRHLTGRVALWNYEVSDAMYRRWLRDVAILDADRVAVLNLRGFRMPIQTARVEEWAVEWLLEHDVKTWIVDPFAAAYKGQSENDNAEVGRFLDALDVIKERAGVAELIMPVHTGRGKAEEGQERSRGATRVDDWADVRWLLTREEKDGITTRYFRAGPGRDVDLPEVRLGYDEDTRRPFVTGSSRYAERLDAYDFDILMAIRQAPGLGTVALRKAVRAMRGSASNDTISRSVERLVSSGRIVIRKDLDGAQTARHYVSDAIDILMSPADQSAHDLGANRTSATPADDAVGDMSLLPGIEPT